MNTDLSNIIIRQESAEDYEEIDNITRRAFGKSGELVAELVNLTQHLTKPSILLMSYDAIWYLDSIQ